MQALGLLPLTDTDQKQLAHLLELPFTHSEKKEVLHNLEEICLRDRLSLVDCLGPLLNAPSIKPIEGRGESQQLHNLASTIRQELNNKRYPLLAKKEAEFAEWKKGLKLPQEISLQHAPNFEQNWIEVKFRYKTKENLQQIIGKLQSLL